MSTTKILIATGVSSGIGFEIIKQLLLDQPHPYRFVLGVRSPAKAQTAIEQLGYDKAKHSVSILECDFADLQKVKTFAHRALEELAQDKLDELLLNHALIKQVSKVPGPRGSTWDETYIVNHLSQHYLMHLLRPTIERSASRVVFVALEASFMVTETASLRSKVLAGSDLGALDMYAATKFAHLLGAHWWRRALGDKASVVAVTPGMVPGTGLERDAQLPAAARAAHPDAKDVPTGARSILAAFTRQDLPEDPNAIFLESEGEWWDPYEIYPLTLGKELQNEFSPSQEEIERDERIE